MSHRVGAKGCQIVPIEDQVQWQTNLATSVPISGNVQIARQLARDSFKRRYAVPFTLLETLARRRPYGLADELEQLNVLE